MSSCRFPWTAIWFFILSLQTIRCLLPAVRRLCESACVLRSDLLEHHVIVVVCLSIFIRNQAVCLLYSKQVYSQTRDSSIDCNDILTLKYNENLVFRNRLPLRTTFSLNQKSPDRLSTSYQYAAYFNLSVCFLFYVTSYHSEQTLLNKREWRYNWIWIQTQDCQSSTVDGICMWENVIDTQ
jgi:hypothetical protein